MTSKDGWRRVGTPWPSLATWAMWALAFYLTLVLLKFVPWAREAVVVAAVPLAITLILVARIAVALLVPLLPLPPPVATPPPPCSSGDVTAWARRPDPTYPLFAQARAQCGWVQLAMRAKSTGRITHVRILAQAPGRIFERAVLATLSKARLPDGLGVSEPAMTVVSFATPGPHTPDWAQLRLTATNTGDADPEAAKPDEGAS